NSENGPLLADGAMNMPTLKNPPLSQRELDLVASATDTRDLIVKMRKRTQGHWLEAESREATDRTNPIEELRRRTKAFWETQLQNPSVEVSPLSMEAPLSDTAEAMAEWSHIVDD